MVWEAAYKHKPSPLWEVPWACKQQKNADPETIVIWGQRWQDQDEPGWRRAHWAHRAKSWAKTALLIQTHSLGTYFFLGQHLLSPFVIPPIWLCDLWFKAGKFWDYLGRRRGLNVTMTCFDCWKLGLQSFRFGFESEDLIAESLELIGAGSRILFRDCRKMASFFSMTLVLMIIWYMPSLFLEVFQKKLWCLWFLCFWNDIRLTDRVYDFLAVFCFTQNQGFWTKVDP